MEKIARRDKIELNATYKSIGVVATVEVDKFLRYNQDVEEFRIGLDTGKSLLRTRIDGIPLSPWVPRVLGLKKGDQVKVTFEVVKRDEEEVNEVTTDTPTYLVEPPPGVTEPKKRGRPKKAVAPGF